VRNVIAGTAVLLTFAAPAAAQQSVAALIVAGDSTRPYMHPDSALRYYQQALAIDSNSYPALWRTGRALVDIAKQIDKDDDASRARRDSLYLRAKAYAERAIQLDSADADGHFVLALALGRLSRTRGGKERVRFGRIIYDESARAIQLRPTHDGAHHILGAWHAEVKQLSGMTKFFAKTFLGGGFLGRASWDSAVTHLSRAVELNPGYIYHRLELAQVYLDLDRPADAKVQLEAIAGLPDSDVLDPGNRRRASQLLEEIRKKSG
jgi:tetratricopeptide (TPR) repeat protein